MSNILISPPPTTLLTGLLQLDGGVAMSSTPVYVADQTNTDSKLALSTTSVNVNTLTGSALVNIKGTGTTSSSNSLIVQNSAGTNVIQALDNTNIYFGKAIKIGSGGTITDTSGYMTMYNGGNTARIGPEYFSTDSSGWSATILGGGPTLSLSYLGYGAIDRNWLVGTSPSNTARLSVKGSGSTSATTSLLVQNSSSSSLLSVFDNGNVGISNSTPYKLLSVKSSTSTEAIEVRATTGNTGIRFSIADTSVTTDNYSKGAIYYLNTGASSAVGTMIFALNNAFTDANVSTADEKMRITSAGYVGINTTNPTARLQINEAQTYNALKCVDTADINRYFSIYMNNAPNLYDLGPTADDSNTILRFYRGAYIVTRVNGTEYMRQESLGVGFFVNGATPTARVQIKGSGSTSATTTMLVQNSSSTQLFKLTDDGRVVIGSGTISGNAFVDIAIGSGSTNGLRVKAYSDAGTGYLFSGGTESFADNFKIKMVNGNVTMGTQLNGYTFGLETFNGVAMHIANAGNIGMGTTSPNVSAKLELNSTTQGFLPPVMTTAQKTAIGSPSKGLIVFDSSLNKLCVYSGTAWETITSV
jgi:hypothetical protein